MSRLPSRSQPQSREFPPSLQSRRNPKGASYSERAGRRKTRVVVSAEAKDRQVFAEALC